MKIATRFGLGFMCAGAFLAAQAFGQSTYTTPEAQKAAAQLSQPAGPPQQAQNDTTINQSDRTTVPGYGTKSTSAADNRPVQPIYENSAATGARPMPMRDMQADNSAMAPRDNGVNNSANGQRGEIGVWLVENGGQGVRVGRLARGGAAERAGLRSGDIITQVNGSSVSSPRTAAQQIRDIPVGQAANLTLMRDGGQQQMQVTLAAARPGQSYEVGYGGEGSGGERSTMSSDRDSSGLAERTARLEMQMATMTEELREMRQQLTEKRGGSDSRSSSGTAQPSADLGTTPSASSSTSSSVTPPQAGAGSATSSSSTTPSATPAAGTSATGSTTPSAASSGSASPSEQDLFGTSPAPAGTSPATGATK